MRTVLHADGTMHFALLRHQEEYFETWHDRIASMRQRPLRSRASRLFCGVVTSIQIRLLKLSAPGPIAAIVMTKASASPHACIKLIRLLTDCSPVCIAPHECGHLRLSVATTAFKQDRPRSQRQGYGLGFLRLAQAFPSKLQHPAWLSY